MSGCGSSTRCRRWLRLSGLHGTASILQNRRTGRMPDLINSLFVFMLAGFIGFEVIRRVSPLLHTPLMSLTNALDAIAVVGAILLAGEHKTTLSTVLGTIAIVAATSNVVADS